MSAWDKSRRALATLWDDRDQQQFSGTSLGVLGAKIGGVLTAFLVQIPLTRLLGAEGYGAYVYVLSLVIIAS